MASSLIGTWRVRAYEVWTPEGEVTTPLGPSPVGYAVFDHTGHAFIQLAQTPAVDHPKSDEAREALANSFAAYFGRYTLSADGTRLTVAVEAGNRASFVGSTQERMINIAGDVLTMGQPGQYRATLVRAGP